MSAELEVERLAIVNSAQLALQSSIEASESAQLAFLEAVRNNDESTFYDRLARAKGAYQSSIADAATTERTLTGLLATYENLQQQVNNLEQSILNAENAVANTERQRAQTETLLAHLTDWRLSYTGKSLLQYTLMPETDVNLAISLGHLGFESFECGLLNTQRNELSGVERHRLFGQQISSEFAADFVFLVSREGAEGEKVFLMRGQFDTEVNLGNSPKVGLLQFFPASEDQISILTSQMANLADSQFCSTPT